jgi:hypothetical protein
MRATNKIRLVCTVIGTLGGAGRPDCQRGLAWLASAMEQVFLRRSVPGIIGFGRAHRVRYPLCDGVASIPSGQETLGESGTMF